MLFQYEIEIWTEANPDSKHIYTVWAETQTGAVRQALEKHRKQVSYAINRLYVSNILQAR